MINSTLQFVNETSKILFEKDTICLTPQQTQEQETLIDTAIKTHYGEKASYEQLLCYVIDEKIKQLEKLKKA